MKWNITNKLSTLLLILITTITACNNNSNNTDFSNNDNGQPNLKDSTTTITTPMNNVEKGSINNIYSGCGYNYTIASNQIEIMTPNHREVDEIKKILTYSGIPLNFEIYSANIENAIATIINNKRYIIYDPKLLAFTDTKSETYWSSMSILAHEIGHHLSGHLMGNSNNHQAELEADKFSGFVLYKMGANIEQSTKAMEIIGSELDSETHPNKTSRIEAIKNGWNEANELRFESAVPPPPEDIINPKGGMDYFGPRNLLDADSYQRLFIDGAAGTGLTSNLEGIILERPKYYYGQYTILITKNNTGDYDGNIAEGNKALIQLHDMFDAVDFVGRVNLTWIDAIMVPGRKIRFDVAVEGTAPYVFFTSIKSLPASK
jgi:hypothetical protein